MHGELEKVEHAVRVPMPKPKLGRVALFSQLVQQTPSEAHHKWQHQRQGVVCERCGKRIKAYSTFEEINRKQATACPGAVTKTLKQVMTELIHDTEGRLEEQPGHKWEMTATSFGCVRCWNKIPLRSSKAVLDHLAASDCKYGQLDEQGLQLRTRVHPSHAVWRRGIWLECRQCKRTSKEQDGRVQQWLAKHCITGKGQQTLRFGPSSSS